MRFPGLGLARLDQVALAFRDLLDVDSLIRGLFGGHTLAGTASIAAAATTLLGTGTAWATGSTDSLAPGDRLVLGDQVAWVDTVTSDTELEIRTAHADGLVGATIHKAARGKRVQSSESPKTRALPFWTVGAGGFADVDPGIGRLIQSPSVEVTFYYDVGHDELDDDEASWAGLLQHVVEIAKTNGGVLCVPRFHDASGNLARLTRGFAGATPGAGEIRLDDDTGLIVPRVVIEWVGQDPLNSADLTQRW